MPNKLKNLYQYLVQHKIENWRDWHDAYQKFYGEVEAIRIRINAGQSLSQDDEPFLRELLYKQYNGIARRGQSVLSEENFQLFIQNQDFLSALEDLIVSPSVDTHRNFDDAWRAQGQTHNPVLINRVAAACTTDVSSTVDVQKFNEVFSWLSDGDYIPHYQGEDSWFAKNTFLLRCIKDALCEELQNGATDKFYLSQFVWAAYQNMSNPFSLKKQIVKYGAPGTGKTYQARQQTSLSFDIWKEQFAPETTLTHESQIELVQFHPSFSYEDFMEGLRPVLDEQGKAQLTLQNGVFKAFCKKAGKWEIEFADLKLDEDWSTLTIENLLPHQEKLSGDHWQSIFECADSSKLVSEAVPPFFFIIDEINRAELSRVFGELMYCLEYRGVKGSVKTQYANLNNDDTCMLKTAQGYQFFIPTNIYLIGTMNTIDRSVESFDFALRRRFRWEEVAPDIRIAQYYLNRYQNEWGNLADNLETLNEEIAQQPLLGRDYQIGHAYLMDLKYSADLSVGDVRKRIWGDCILPLLQEYLRGTGKEKELIDRFRVAFGG